MPANHRGVVLQASHREVVLQGCTASKPPVHEDEDEDNKDEDETASHREVVLQASRREAVLQAATERTPNKRQSILQATMEARTTNAIVPTTTVEAPTRARVHTMVACLSKEL